MQCACVCIFYLSFFLHFLLIGKLWNVRINKLKFSKVFLYKTNFGGLEIKYCLTMWKIIAHYNIDLFITFIFIFRKSWNQYSWWYFQWRCLPKFWPRVSYCTKTVTCEIFGTSWTSLSCLQGKNTVFSIILSFIIFIFIIVLCFWKYLEAIEIKLWFYCVHKSNLKLSTIKNVAHPVLHNYRDKWVII